MLLPVLREMKTIIRSTDERTILSIRTGHISLKIGKSFDDSRIRDLLRIVNGLFVTLINPDQDCYGHITFEKSKIIITLSSNPERPNPFDLRYRRDW